MTSLAANDPHVTPARKPKLILPFMGNFYEGFAQPFAWVALRVAVGAVLAYEGWIKMGNPFGHAALAETLFLYPGWFWSVVLSCANFFGGLFIIFGVLTRPAALANTVMLAITLFFHIANPYGDALLTQAGMELLKTPEAAQYFTPNGLARLADGGARFLHQVQGKAVFNSLFWTGACALFAAHGGGAWSLDRLLKREF